MWLGSALAHFRGSAPLEVVKAATGLEAGKSAGPDGCPAEVYTLLQEQRPVMAALFTSILETGQIPDSWPRKSPGEAGESSSGL